MGNMAAARATEMMELVALDLVAMERASVDLEAVEAWVQVIKEAGVGSAEVTEVTVVAWGVVEAAMVGEETKFVVKAGAWDWKARAVILVESLGEELTAAAVWLEAALVVV